MKSFVTLILLLCPVILVKTYLIETSVPQKCPSYTKLNSIPGNGWCNLRNIELHPVFEITYNECHVLETPSGNYLIPDHLHITPMSSSDVDTYGEIIDDHQNFTSIIARSMSASASASAGRGFSAGSFSDEYKQMKKTQVENKSVTTRVTGRYVLHSAKLDPNAFELHPDLKLQLLDAIEALTVGDVAKASMILENTIQTHGTHAITSIDLGGVIAKEDYISKTYRAKFDSDQHAIAVSASIGYSRYFNGTGSFTSQDYGKQYEEYRKNIKSTKISSYGGELFQPTSNISSWVKSIPNHLVTVDRSGVLLPSLITSKRFPNVNQSILAALHHEYHEAIEQFNAVNIRVGCMNQYSPNFDYNANVADKSCINPPTNYSLGGLYQSCFCSRWDGFDPYECSECNKYVRNNYLTGNTSCPAMFSPVYLNGKVLKKCWETCAKWWTFAGCRRNCMEYKAFWCVANSNSIPNTGLMFGGSFTSTANNPVTGSNSCPPYFNNATILQDLTVCTSNLYELGFKYSVHFGGFFTCQQGNPLASISSSNKNTSELITGAPMACSDGYSQHTAAIDNDCIINYCVIANSFGSGHNELPIVLPPFQNYDLILEEEVSVNNGMSVIVGPSYFTIICIFCWIYKMEFEKA